MQLLGEWSNNPAGGKLLIFVNKQNLCDQLFSKLMRFKYYCQARAGWRNRRLTPSALSAALTADYGRLGFGHVMI